MKVSYNVLKKYIPELESAEQVAKLLTMHTAEVEEIHEHGAHLEKVFVAYVKATKKHPDSDKLNLCEIEYEGETLQIVCGAPNVT
jgi:phenylalanyl-tRNA synthetase beta chain